MPVPLYRGKVAPSVIIKEPEETDIKRITITKHNLD